MANSRFNPDRLLDDPYLHTGLSSIYENLSPSNESISKCFNFWNRYQTIEGFLDFAIALGVKKELMVSKTNVNNLHPNYQDLRQDHDQAKKSSKTLDEDYTIENLSEMLDKKNISINLLLWNTMMKSNIDIFTAKYRANDRFKLYTAPSSICIKLTNSEWVPVKDGRFLKPCDVNRHMLLDEFVYDNTNGWLSSIGFSNNIHTSAEQEIAEKLGLTKPDDIKQVMELSELLRSANPKQKAELQTLLNEFKMRGAAVEFPKKESHDPERRAEKVREALTEAPKKEYEKKERSIRTSKASVDKQTSLKKMYTNSADQMVCQLCKKEMPFKKRDGEYYFEAVELFNDLSIEHAAVHTALCPVCSAMFKEFIKGDPIKSAELKQLFFSTNNLEIPLTLGTKEMTLSFVEPHFQDVKVVIETSTSPSD